MKNMRNLILSRRHSSRFHSSCFHSPRYHSLRFHLSRRLLPCCLLPCCLSLFLSACAPAGTIPTPSSDGRESPGMESMETMETAGIVPENSPYGVLTPSSSGPGTGQADEPPVPDTGSTLLERIQAPAGFTRVPAAEGSFLQFVRDYPLLPSGSPVLLYNGEEKGNQTAHTAVFDMPLSGRDLQQCADSVLRIYAEYFRSCGRTERVSFHFVNGFLFSYDKWKDGYRISVNGNDVNWVKKTGPSDSEETFASYLDTLFAYASTLSMSEESVPQELASLKAGDVFLKGGSPGHVVMVADLCEDASGKKAFLLAQGYMPAQQFHLLKNPLHPEDPWYYETEFAWPFVTPEYTFQEGALRAMNYGVE